MHVDVHGKLVVTFKNFYEKLKRKENCRRFKIYDTRMLWDYNQMAPEAKVC